MADKDGNIIAKDYGIGIKPPAQHFHVKGHENAGWGMKARLSQIFAAEVIVFYLGTHCLLDGNLCISL